MQTEEEAQSSYSMIMDSWSIFLYGMNAPMTREKYKGRLTKFFNFISLNVGTIEGHAKVFTERGYCNICSQVRLRYDRSKLNADKSLTKIGADKDFYALHELLCMERRAWLLDEV